MKGGKYNMLLNIRGIDVEKANKANNKYNTLKFHGLTITPDMSGISDRCDASGLLHCSHILLFIACVI